MTDLWGSGLKEFIVNLQVLAIEHKIRRDAS